MTGAEPFPAPIEPDAHALRSTARAPRIVVGIDGSPSSVDALREAVTVATAFGGTVEAVGAWHHPATLEAYYPAGECSPEHDASESVATAAREVFADAPPAWFSWSVQQGGAAHVLVEASRGAKLLIVGSRGHGGVVGLLLGSVSAACAERAECPVLIMHKPHPRKPVLQRRSGGAAA